MTVKPLRDVIHDAIADLVAVVEIDPDYDFGTENWHLVDGAKEALTLLATLPIPTNGQPEN